MSHINRARRSRHHATHHPTARGSLCTAADGRATADRGPALHPPHPPGRPRPCAKRLCRSFNRCGLLVACSGEMAFVPHGPPPIVPNESGVANRARMRHWTAGGNKCFGCVRRIVDRLVVVCAVSRTSSRLLLCCSSSRATATFVGARVLSSLRCFCAVSFVAIVSTGTSHEPRAPFVCCRRIHRHDQNANAYLLAAAFSDNLTTQLNIDAAMTNAVQAQGSR